MVRSISGGRQKVRSHHSRPWLHAGSVGTQLWQVWHLPPTLSTLTSSRAYIPEAAMNKQLSLTKIVKEFALFPPKKKNNNPKI